MSAFYDPLQHGFYCVDYVLWEKNRVAVHYDLVSAQQSMMSMIKRGVDCKGLREWKPTSK